MRHSPVLLRSRSSLGHVVQSSQTTPFLARSAASTQQVQREPPSLENLPGDLRSLIFSQLSPRDLCMLAAVSRRCRDNVDDNGVWQPHIQKLGQEYGMRLLPTASLHHLYCDIKNRQRLYSRRSSKPNQLQSTVAASFSSVKATPQERALNLLSIAPATLTHSGKENAVPFRLRPSNQLPDLQLQCPSCSASAEYPLKHDHFAACSTCWHAFCTICLKAPQDHAQTAPCNPRQYINPQETLSVLRALQPHQPKPAIDTRRVEEAGSSVSPSKRKAVLEPQVTSPNKRKAPSKQQAIQRLRRL